MLSICILPLAAMLSLAANEVVATFGNQSATTTPHVSANHTTAIFRANNSGAIWTTFSSTPHHNAATEHHGSMMPTTNAPPRTSVDMKHKENLPSTVKAGMKEGDDKMRLKQAKASMDASNSHRMPYLDHNPRNAMNHSNETAWPVGNKAAPTESQSRPQTPIRKNFVAAAARSDQRHVEADHNNLTMSSHKDCIEQILEFSSCVRSSFLQKSSLDIELSRAYQADVSKCFTDQNCIAISSSHEDKLPEGEFSSKNNSLTFGQFQRWFHGLNAGQKSCAIAHLRMGAGDHFQKCMAQKIAGFRLSPNATKSMNVDAEKLQEVVRFRAKIQMALSNCTAKESVVDICLSNVRMKYFGQSCSLADSCSIVKPIGACLKLLSDARTYACGCSTRDHEAVNQKLRRLQSQAKNSEDPFLKRAKESELSKQLQQDGSSDAKSTDDNSEVTSLVSPDKSESIKVRLHQQCGISVPNFQPDTTHEMKDAEAEEVQRRELALHISFFLDAHVEKSESSFCGNCDQLFQ